MTAPPEYRDAVGLWARDHGRGGGDLVYIPAIDCWQVRLNPMPNDPRMEMVQKGKIDRSELYETIELMEPRSPEEIAASDDKSPYRPIRLEDLGIDGVLALLDKGNMWSKRGEFNSLQEAVVAARVRQQKGKEETRRAVREGVKEAFQEVRRVVNKIPFLTVGADLKPPSRKEVTP